MNLSFSQIIDIKCILADRSKKQIASDLCISPMTLSREIKDHEILKDLSDYFDEIDVEINRFCDKLRETSSVVNEPSAEYRPLDSYERTIAEKEYIIKIQNELIESINKHNKHLEEEKDQLTMRLIKYEEIGYTLITTEPNQKVG